MLLIHVGRLTLPTWLFFFYFLISLSFLPPGFAVNLQVILANPRALFKRRGSQPGMQESDFLKQITKVTDLEPKASNCTRVSNLDVFCYHGSRRVESSWLFNNASQGPSRTVITQCAYFYYAFQLIHWFDTSRKVKLQIERPRAVNDSLGCFLLQGLIQGFILHYYFNMFTSLNPRR